MNKKRSLHTLLFIILIMLLAACGTASDESNENDASPEKETSSEKEQNDEDSTDTKDTNSSTDNEENAAEDEESSDDEQSASTPSYSVTSDWYVTPEEEDADEQVVLLTIDDAPDEHAVEMAKTLDKLGVSAIFFVNGHFIQDDEGKKKLQEIDELGFPIGNHTMTHANLTTLSEEEQKEEIIGVNKLIEEAIGKKPGFFRAPFGENTDYSEQIAEDEGMLLMNWAYGYDWDKEYQETEAIKDIMINTPLLSDGAILLMHDRDWTNEALEDIVTGLQDKGYDMLDPAKIETLDDGVE